MIAFLFKDNPFGESFFLEVPGEMGGWVGTSGPRWVRKRLQPLAGPSVGSVDFGLTGFQGAMPGET